MCEVWVWCDQSLPRSRDPRPETFTNRSPLLSVFAFLGTFNTFFTFNFSRRLCSSLVRSLFYRCFSLSRNPLDSLKLVWMVRVLALPQRPTDVVHAWTSPPSLNRARVVDSRRPPLSLSSRLQAMWHTHVPSSESLRRLRADFSSSWISYSLPRLALSLAFNRARVEDCRRPAI